MIEALRTTAFRWALGIALWSISLSLLLLAFVYWQTGTFVQAELAHRLRHELRYVAAEPGASVSRLEIWLGEDLHNVRFAGLFGPDGAKLIGNLDALPLGLSPDGEVHRIGTPVMIAGRRLREELWMAASRLADGRTLVVAHDTDEIDRAKATVLRALTLALGPVLVLSGLGGLLLAARARRRVKATQEAIAQVRRGDLDQRLPVRGTDDEFDRLAQDVNGMLAEIARLMEEVRSVGDAIAHDLRTPLTRLRARLERSRTGAHSLAELEEVIDQSLVWLDQTLSIITAVLRIGEIQHKHRCAEFSRVDVAQVLAEAAELYEPIAEDKSIQICVEITHPFPFLTGDRDLLFEAVTNLIDNAVKFTPACGLVRLEVSRRGAICIVAVEDTGPGIPPAERDQVFRRFYRAEPARHTIGNGLGLGLVAAIVELHGFQAVIADAPEGGCRFEILCPATIDRGALHTVAVISA